MQINSLVWLAVIIYPQVTPLFFVNKNCGQSHAGSLVSNQLLTFYSWEERAGWSVWWPRRRRDASGVRVRAARGSRAAARCG